MKPAPVILCLFASLVGSTASRADPTFAPGAATWLSPASTTFAVDTATDRIAFEAGLLDAIVATTIAAGLPEIATPRQRSIGLPLDALAVAEPSTVALVFAGIAVLFSVTTRRRARSTKTRSRLSAPSGH